MKIHVGDVIEYIARVPVHGIKADQIQTRKGKVIQITDHFITIQGERYPETILINDIKTGKVKFLKLVTSVDEEGSNLRNTRYSDRPWDEIIDRAIQLIKTENLSVYRAAKKLAPEYRVPINIMYYRFREAGVGSDCDPEDPIVDTNINIEGEGAMENNDTSLTTGDQIDLSMVLTELKKKWIQDVLITTLPSHAQISIIEKIIQLEGVA